MFEKTEPSVERSVLTCSTSRLNCATMLTSSVAEEEVVASTCEMVATIGAATTGAGAGAAAAAGTGGAAVVAFLAAARLTTGVAEDIFLMLMVEEVLWGYKRREYNHTNAFWGRQFWPPGH